MERKLVQEAGWKPGNPAEVGEEPLGLQDEVRARAVRAPETGVTLMFTMTTRVLRRCHEPHKSQGFDDL